LLAGLGSAQTTNYFDVIVNNSLYSSGQITSSITQYLNDITAQGYTPRLVTTSFVDPAALRSTLANDYATYGIKGAVMVGDSRVGGRALGRERSAIGNSRRRGHRA